MTSSHTQALRIVLNRVQGYDMVITIYAPNISANIIEAAYLKKQLGSDMEVDTVDLEFAKLHPKHYRCCMADVEECFFLDTIHVPRRNEGDDVDTWLDGSAKHLDWQIFLISGPRAWLGIAR
jgi:hypothetical protein